MANRSWVGGCQVQRRLLASMPRSARDSGNPARTAKRRTAFTHGTLLTGSTDLRAPTRHSSATGGSPGRGENGCPHWWVRRTNSGMKHSSPEFAAIAERGTILRVQVGSGLHGTAIKGQDDRDEMGICVEPPEYVVGLSRFEQYIFRTQPEGHRSGPGDLD